MTYIPSSLRTASITYQTQSATTKERANANERTFPDPNRIFPRDAEFDFVAVDVLVALDDVVDATEERVFPGADVVNVPV